jgi:hypothetical protein
VNSSLQCIRVVIVLLCLFAVLNTEAQNPSQFKNWNPPSNEVRVKPKLNCPDLRSLTGYEFSIITASAIAGTADVPEHCLVSGQILPEIRFEVDLPAAWNRRLYMFGNGGYAGRFFEWPVSIEQRNLALRHGFAIAVTDTGHDKASEPGASFAINRQKLIDFAFRSVHTTVQTAKQLILAYYGQAESHAYFGGCSKGGSQALISAQRFPKDFDGVIVGDPMIDYVGSNISSVWTIRALIEAPISSAKAKLLTERIYAVCDEKDGLKDGSIENPLKCDFVPSRDLPKCSGDSDGNDCFTAKQIAAIERIRADISSQGKIIFPGRPIGTEIDSIATDAPNPHPYFAENFFRYMAFPEQDPKYDLAQFDFDKDPSRMTLIRQMMNATDSDLSQLQSRGGKILMYHGWGDPGLNPRMSVSYYEKVADRMGPVTSNFLRLFMVPGMSHCGGGVGVDRFDTITPLVNWVEKGVAPDQIIGARVVDGKTVRTRPLCPYPQTAKYKGTGSIDEAANFACRQP